MTRFVYFDAVGTLIEAEPSVTAVYRAAGRRHGLDVTPETLRSRFATAILRLRAPLPAAANRPTIDGGRAGAAGRLPILEDHESASRSAWRAIVADVFGHPPTDVLALLFDELWTHFGRSSAWRLRPGAEGRLRRLADADVPWGIASNFDHRLRAVLAGLDLPSAPRAVVLGPELGVLKPDRAFFDHAAAVVAWTLAGDAGAFELWGDDPVEDGRGALGAGWRAVLVGDPTPPGVFAGVGPDENLWHTATLADEPVRIEA